MVLMFMFCFSVNAVKYVDGRFVKNTQLQECMKKIVQQCREYKALNDDYLIHPECMRFSFSVKKKDQKIKHISIIIPVASEREVWSFYVSLYHNGEISSLELVNLFLNSNEFNEQNYNINDAKCVAIEAWEPDRVNQYDNWYSLMTDITEDNWRQKFSGEEEDDANPELCPGALMFFELQPGEKVFVEGYEV